MANLFTSVEGKVPKRSKFRMNHQAKLTMEMGELVPIFCQDVLPGDRWRVSTQQLIRFAPMIAPLMSDVDAYVHFYFVPDRIINSNFEKLITGSKNGKVLKEEDIPTYPYLAVSNQFLNKTPDQINKTSENWDGKPYVSDGSLPDYLQFPTVKKSFVPSRLDGTFEMHEGPLRAYQRIYFDWYRDENLSPFDDFEEIDNDKYNNGANNIDSLSDDEAMKRFHRLTKLQRRAWKKDYFTSALPFAQKGDEVLIPGSSAVGFKPLSPNPSNPNTNFIGISNIGGTTASGQLYSQNSTDGVSSAIRTSYGSSGNSQDHRFLYERFGIDFGSSDGIGEGTIRELRRAMAAQRFLERQAVGGSRYIEQIYAFFGVKSSDARLQRSEFLGGSKQPIVVSQVLQTSQTTQGDDGSPLGQPAGNAVSAGGKYIFDRTFEEHGWIIGLISVIPRAEYMNGMPRKYLRRDRWDYYWPQFQHIGEQAIDRQEVLYDFNDSTHNPETFGYTPRYAEYRFINSHVHGDFKDTLDFWTLVRDFGQDQPVLNESFIECKPADRIWAYNSKDSTKQFNHLWCQIGFAVDTLRPMSKYGESI